MKHEIIEIEDPILKTISKSVLIIREDGSMESFPVDETNPRYIQFIEETS